MFFHVKYALEVDKLELELQGSTLKTLEKIRAMAKWGLDGISLRMALYRKYTVDDTVLKER